MVVLQGMEMVMEKARVTVEQLAMVMELVEQLLVPTYDDRSVIKPLRRINKESVLLEFAFFADNQIDHSGLK
jgi:hypothetical protein